MKRTTCFLRWAAFCALLSTLNPQLSTAFAQGTAVTYQGQLSDGSGPANGSYDLQFAIWDSLAGGATIAGPLTSPTTGVSNGLFTVVLDFGPGAFTGPRRWLEIGVRTNGSGGSYSTLTPRQELTSTPYAMMAASAGGLPGFQVLQNATSPNLVGGYSGNGVGADAVGATIGGGGMAGATNFVSGTSRFGTIGGGALDLVQGNYGVVGGGLRNTVNVAGNSATVGGGHDNLAAGPSTTVAGGSENTAGSVAATISGGNSNSASANYATVGGGQLNTSSGAAATTPGGSNNVAQGAYSFAAGQNAQALNTGAFVWADASSTTPFGSTADNQLLLRASGGVGINTNNPNGAALNVNGTVAATNFSGSGAGLTGLPGGAISPGSIGNAAIAANAISAGQINSGQVVKSLNGLMDNVTLSAGPNVTLTPNGQIIQISAPGTGGNGWNTNGNNVLPGQFLGSTNKAPVELWANNSRALRLEPNVSSGAPNIVGGAAVNFVLAGVVGAVIGGGGATNYAGSHTNSVSGDFGVIVGGYDNQIQPNAAASTIGGGDHNTVQTFAGGSAIPGGSGNTIQTNAPNSTIGGGSGNTIQTNAMLSTIGGGSGNQVSGVCSFIGGGGASLYGSGGNTNAGNSAVIGGGSGNQIAAGADSSTIGGGSGNTIQTNASYSTIGGGWGNQVSGLCSVIGGGGAGLDGVGGNTNAGNAAVIGGGWGNQIAAGAEGATIGGGYDNTIQTNATYATIAGGSSNTNSGPYGTVPGGDQNVAGTNSFAAGHRAKATYQGDFVWADSAPADFAATGNNQFLIRASGGVGIGTAPKGDAMDVNGTVGTFGAGLDGSTYQKFVLYADSGNGLRFDAPQDSSSTKLPIHFSWRGGTEGMNLTYVPAFFPNVPKANLTVNGDVYGMSFNTTSDRNQKENFAPVSPAEVLAKVSALPIARWNFKGDEATPHIGPMAQDFHAAFGTGADDKHIASVDADGVALAAIQGLNQKLEQKDAKISALEKRLAALEEMFSREQNGKGGGR